MAKAWYVIHTRTGFEERVLKLLQLLPRRLYFALIRRATGL